MKQLKQRIERHLHTNKLASMMGACQKNGLTVSLVLSVHCHAVSLKEAMSLELEHPDVTSLERLADGLKFDNLRESGLDFAHQLHNLIVQHTGDALARRDQHLVHEVVVKGR